MSLEPCQSLFLSPHLDDVVLSCGGTIHRRAARGEGSLVISIFAGSPADDAHSAFAQELRDRWGGARDPVGVRRAEDLTALHAVGAEALHLDMLDCVYRTGRESGAVLYPTVEHIFGDVHAEEASLHLAVLEALRPALREHPCATVYAPLTVGHHVDHIITLRAALILHQEGREVSCYEDFPYAVRSDVVARALALLAPASECWVRSVEALAEDDVRAKADGVAAYRSQISTFWPGDDAMRSEIAAYAQAVGQGPAGEAFWRLPRS